MYYHFCPEKNTKHKKEVEEVGRYSNMLGESSVRSERRTIVEDGKGNVDENDEDIFHPESVS